MPKSLTPLASATITWLTSIQCIWATELIHESVVVCLVGFLDAFIEEEMSIPTIKLGNLWALSRGAKIFDTVGISNDHVIDIHTMYLSYWDIHIWVWGCLFVWFCGRFHRRITEYFYKNSVSCRVMRCQNLCHCWHQQWSRDWHPYNISELLRYSYMRLGLFVCLVGWFCGHVHRRISEYSYKNLVSCRISKISIKKDRKSMSVVASLSNLWHRLHQQWSHD